MPRRRVDRYIRRLLMIFLMLAGLRLTAQEKAVMTLKPQPMKYKAAGYYIADVVDDRNETGIGTARRNTAIVLPEGTAPALKQYLQASFSQDRSGTPITMHITKLEINTRQKGSTWLTDADIMFTYYFGDQEIADMGGTASTQSGDYNLKYGADQLQRLTESSLKNFGRFWEQNKARVPLTKDIRVNVSIATQTDKKGCIVYSNARKLVVADFLAPSLPEKYRRQGAEDIAACTSSGMEKDMHLEVRNSQYELDVSIVPMFSKHESWFREDADANVLAHEQNHFDITALQACKLQRDLRNAHLTIDNYQEVLNKLFETRVEEHTAEQDRYDDETAHGTISDKQAAWSRKIAAELNSCGCYR